MGKASIWAQWSIIVTGLVLSPVILLFTAGVLGWSLASRATAGRRTTPDPGAAPGSGAAAE